jgi:organic hydroperoxide reductase OsmC/OhrA
MFYYETEVDWWKEREGQLSGPGLPSLSVGAPPQFKGREGNWTPEHLFVASVNPCFMLTLVALAENSKLPLLQIPDKGSFFNPRDIFDHRATLMP